MRHTTCSQMQRSGVVTIVGKSDDDNADGGLAFYYYYFLEVRVSNVCGFREDVDQPQQQGFNQGFNPFGGGQQFHFKFN